MDINHLKTLPDDKLKEKKAVIVHDSCTEVLASSNDKRNKRFHPSRLAKNFKDAESTNYMEISSPQTGDLASISDIASTCKAEVTDFNMMLEGKGKNTGCEMEQIVRADSLLDIKEIAYEESMHARNIFHCYDAMLSHSGDGFPESLGQVEKNVPEASEITDEQFHFERDTSSSLRQTCRDMELCTTLNSISRMTGGSFTFGNEDDSPNSSPSSNNEYEFDLVIKITVDGNETNQNMCYSSQGTDQVKSINYSSQNTDIGVVNKEDPSFVPCSGSHESKTWVALPLHSPIKSSLEESKSDLIEDEHYSSAENILIHKSCNSEVRHDNLWKSRFTDFSTHQNIDVNSFAKDRPTKMAKLNENNTRRKTVINNADNLVQKPSHKDHVKPLRCQQKEENAEKNKEENQKYFYYSEPEKIRGNKTTMRESKKSNHSNELTTKKHFFERMKQHDLDEKITTTNRQSITNEKFETTDDLWDDLDEIFKSFEAEGKSWSSASPSLDQTQKEKSQSSTLTNYDENAFGLDFDLTFNQDNIFESYEAEGKPYPSYSTSLDQVQRKEPRTFTATNYEKNTYGLDFDSTFNLQLNNEASNQQNCRSNTKNVDNGNFHLIETNEKYFKENIQAVNYVTGLPSKASNTDKTFLNQAGSNFSETCYVATKKAKLEKNPTNTFSSIDYKDISLDSTWESLFDRYNFKSLSTVNQKFADLGGQTQPLTSSTKYNDGYTTLIEKKNRGSPTIMIEDYNLDFYMLWDSEFDRLDSRAPSTRQQNALFEGQSQALLTSKENNCHSAISIIEKEIKDSAPLMTDQNKDLASIKERKIARENDIIHDSTWDSIFSKHDFMERKPRSSVIRKQDNFTGSTTSKEKGKNYSATAITNSTIESATIDENHISLNDTWSSDSILGMEALNNSSTSGHTCADLEGQSQSLIISTQDTDFSSTSAMEKENKNLVTSIKDHNLDFTTVMENKYDQKNVIETHRSLNLWQDFTISSSSSEETANFKSQLQPLISSLQDNSCSNPALEKESKDSDTVIKSLNIESDNRSENIHGNGRSLQKKNNLLNTLGCSNELHSSDSKNSSSNSTIIILEETVTNNDVDSVLKPKIGEEDNNSANNGNMQFGSDIEEGEETNNYVFP